MFCMYFSYENYCTLKKKKKIDAKFWIKNLDTSQKEKKKNGRKKKKTSIITCKSW